MKNKDFKAFSLVIAIFLILVCNITAIYLLQYIIPFLRNTKGMEFGVSAYYEAYSGIEDVLYAMKTKDAYYETGKTMPSGSVGYDYNLSSLGYIIPTPGEGTSEYDINYNLLSTNQSSQLLLKGNINWNNVNFVFKVPDLDSNTGTTETLSGSSLPMINRKLSSDTDTLTCSGNYIMGSDINNSNSSDSVKLYNRVGYLLDGSASSFQNFYTNNNCATNGCTLKLYALNSSMQTTVGNQIPYIEYKIDLSTTGIKIANYYAKIDTSGKSYGYKKDLELYIPQQTTIGAFDFTIFQ